MKPGYLVLNDQQRTKSTSFSDRAFESFIIFFPRLLGGAGFESRNVASGKTTRRPRAQAGPACPFLLSVHTHDEWFRLP